MQAHALQPRVHLVEFRVASCIRLHLMRIPIFPASRTGRVLCMALAILGVLGCLAKAKDDYRTEKDFADHGAVADVLPVDGYLQHYFSSRNSDVKVKSWQSADLSFRTPDGATWTVTRGLDDDEIETLKGGGALHMQYLPEHPQFSARLEGHPRKPWENLLFAGLLALYALALKPPAQSRTR
jgi:hypothetical protein